MPIEIREGYTGFNFCASDNGMSSEDSERLVEMINRLDVVNPDEWEGSECDEWYGIYVNPITQEAHVIYSNSAKNIEGFNWADIEDVSFEEAERRVINALNNLHNIETPSEKSTLAEFIDKLNENK